MRTGAVRSYESLASTMCSHKIACATYRCPQAASIQRQTKQHGLSFSYYVNPLFRARVKSSFHIIFNNTWMEKLTECRIGHEIQQIEEDEVLKIKKQISHYTSVKQGIFSLFQAPVEPRQPACIFLVEGRGMLITPIVPKLQPVMPLQAHLSLPFIFFSLLALFPPIRFIFHVICNHTSP